MNTIDNSGHIEVRTLSEPASVGDRVLLVFYTEDELTPPFKVKIWSPSGKMILEVVLRELPSGRAQGAQPVSFSPSTPGPYRVEVMQVQGKIGGSATITINA